MALLTPRHRAPVPSPPPEGPRSAHRTARAAHCPLLQVRSQPGVREVWCGFQESEGESAKLLMCSWNVLGRSVNPKVFPGKWGRAASPGHFPATGRACCPNPNTFHSHAKNTSPGPCWEGWGSPVLCWEAFQPCRSQEQPGSLPARPHKPI